MISERAPNLEEPKPEAEARPATRSYYSRESAGMRRRIADLKKIGRDSFGPVIPETAAGQQFRTIVLHHLAHFIEGAQLAENYLGTSTRMGRTERAAAIDEARKTKRLYKADDLAGMLGITMAKRTALGLTTVGAIDCDREARAKLQNEKRNAARREKRKRDKASLAIPMPPQRRADRRIAAIFAALPEEGPLSVVELCARLAGTKQFAGVSPNAMRPAVHRLLKADGGRLFEHVTPPKGSQPFAGTFVARRGSETPARAKPRPAPAEKPRLPTDEDSYRRYLEEELGRISPEHIEETQAWFHDPDERELRNKCGVGHLERELAAFVRRRQIDMLKQSRRAPADVR